MSSGEVLLPEGEIIKITDGVADWIQAERNVSNLDRNNYLDRLDEQRRMMTLSMDDPSNQKASKLFSHLQRIPIWFQAFALDPTDDYQTAKIIFSPLMLVSGRYRLQRLLQASNQEDYYRRKGSLGDLKFELADAISHRIATLGETKLDLPTLQATAQSCIETAVKQEEEINVRAAEGVDFGLDESPSVDIIQAGKRLWTEFAADLIVYARQTRGGDLSAVPLLEAKSISDDPQVYYPFAIS